MTTQPGKKRNPARAILWSLIAFICLCGFLFSRSVKNTPPPPAPPTNTPSQTRPPTETATPTATLNQAAEKPTITFTPAPTNTPAPTFTSDPYAAFKKDVRRILGTGNRSVPRVAAINFNDPEPGAIFINWALNDLYTTSLTGYGARSEATKILEALHESGLNYTYIILSGSFSMIDKFGNASEDNIFNLTFYKSTVEKINWNNFLVDDIDNIADNAFIHPDLRDD